MEGAFYWLNNREVRWRPEHFWKPGTAVDVAVNTYGVDLGEGMFGEDNVQTHFTIGDEVIATADDNTKILTVRVNGEVVKSMPTSMGKDSTPTANGIYIVGSRYKHIIMDSSTYGVPVNSPNGYRTDVDWATQISYSGVFVHSAPWSVGAQGHTNTSHGCLNVSPSNAQWFYDHVKRGDIVEVVNTVGGTCRGSTGSAIGTFRGTSGAPVTPRRKRAARTPDNQQRLIHALQRPHGSLYDDDIRWPQCPTARTMTTLGCSFATGRTTETG